MKIKNCIKNCKKIFKRNLVSGVFLACKNKRNKCGSRVVFTSVDVFREGWALKDGKFKD